VALVFITWLWECFRPGWAVESGVSFHLSLSVILFLYEWRAEYVHTVDVESV
jgi:hypothetical protein